MKIKEDATDYKHIRILLNDYVKADMSGLCENCVKHYIHVDPDGWIEDRTEILKLKLLLSNTHSFKILITPSTYRDK